MTGGKLPDRAAESDLLNIEMAGSANELTMWRKTRLLKNRFESAREQRAILKNPRFHIDTVSNRLQ